MFRCIQTIWLHTVFWPPTAYSQRLHQPAYFSALQQTRVTSLHRPPPKKKKRNDYWLVLCSFGLRRRRLTLFFGKGDSERVSLIPVRGAHRHSQTRGTTTKSRGKLAVAASHSNCISLLLNPIYSVHFTYYYHGLVWDLIFHLPLFSPSCIQSRPTNRYNSAISSIYSNLQTDRLFPPFS